MLRQIQHTTKVDTETRNTNLIHTTSGPIKNITLSHSSNPSWKRTCEGWAQIEVSRHAEAAYLTIWLTEFDKETQRSRVTSITLDGEAATALAAFLATHQNEGNVVHKDLIYGKP